MIVKYSVLNFSFDIIPLTSVELNIPGPESPVIMVTVEVFIHLVFTFFFLIERKSKFYTGTKKSLFQLETQYRN